MFRFLMIWLVLLGLSVGSYAKNYEKYAFYGEVGIGIYNVNFSNYRKATIPIVGDILIAKKDINIRADYIKKTSNGWKNAKIIGTLHEEDEIKVIEIKEVFTNYFWVKFK